MELIDQEFRKFNNKSSSLGPSSRATPEHVYKPIWRIFRKNMNTEVILEMDGLTSTYSKLHDAQVPLKERTELCRYILEGSDCFFPNKNQVLTDWLCQELHHLRVLQGKKDGKVSLDVRRNQAELWKLLHDVLRSPLSEHIMVRQRFLLVLFDELTRWKSHFEDNIVVDDIMDEVYCSCATSVFLCCQEMLKNVQMSLLLFNRLDNIEQFLTEVLSCFLAVLSIKSGALVEVLCCLVTLVLQQYGAVQRRQVVQRKVFGNLCEKLLGLLLMVKVVVDDENSISTKREITSELDAVIAGGLFHKEHIMHYKPAVDDSKSDEPCSKKQRLSGYPSRLFEVLRSSPVELGLAGGLWWRSVCKSLPFLLKSFLEAVKDEQKLERSAKFNFFIELYNLIPLKGGSTNHPAIPQVDRIAILNQMLQVMLEYNVYQIAEDNANDELLFKWLVNLTKCLVQSPGDCDVLFQSLGILLKLNHKIIEQFLEEIIEQCLVNSNENPEVVRNEKVKFFSNLVETYSKLHQVEHLMKQMLKVVENSEQSIGPIPVEVLTKLSQAFERYPMNLTLRLCQLFLDAMKTQTDYLKPCFTQGGNPNKGFNGTAMEAITVLFVTFLCNSSYSASDQHGLDPQKANALQQFIETANVSVLTRLIKAFPVAAEFCQKEIGFCALYLLYGLNKVTEFLNHHDVCTVDCGEVQISWSSKCGTFIPNKSWATVKMVTKSGQLQFCTDLLAVQRAQCLLASRKPDKEELACLLKYLYNFSDHHANPKVGTWNADLCCITTANYQVAHWSLVARHAPLLLPHCGDPEICGFSKNFLMTLSFGNKESQQDDSLISVTQVSEKLLEANELLGLSSLQTAMVQEFWEIAGESADKVAGGKLPMLTNVFAWSGSECQPSENQDSEKDGTTGNGVMSVLDTENDETEFHESSKVEIRAEDAIVDSLESTKPEVQHATSLSEGLAKLMNDEVKKMAKKRPEKKKDKKAAKHSRCLRDIENLLGVLQRLCYPSFTPSNQTRCILSLLACDILAAKCASRVGRGSELALQHSCRLSLNALIQGVLRLRDFTAWRLVDVGALVSWVHATMVPPDEAPEMQESELHVTHANVSNKLLGLLVKLALKCRRAASLTAIRGFNDQLLASVVDEIAESDAKNLEIVLTVVSTCVEFLQQKLLSKSSASTASAVIVNAAESLLEAIKLFLKGRATAAGSNGESCSNLEILVLRLSGTITRAIGLLSHSKNSWNEDERLTDWSQIVALVISRVMPTLENEVSSRTSLELAVTCVTVLEDITQFDTRYRDVLPEEFHTWILRICLEILRTRGLRSETVIDEARLGEDSELGDAILRLLSTLLEVNDGEHCTSLLGSLVDASVQGIDEQPHSKLLVGLSVFKKLLANKVVKKRKKDLRPIFGNVLIAILNHAATANLDVVTVVLEVIAGIITLGSGTLYPQDLALVFQALALACDTQVNDQHMFARLFMARFGILSWTLFYYPDYIYGVIHVFLTCVRDLLSGLLTEGSKSFDDFDVATTVLASCGQKMARLYQEVASHKDVLSKYSSYVLVDCIHIFSTQGIPGSIRDTLIEGVHYLFDVCSDEALTRVHVHLPSSERELFRSIKEDFNKHHKFKGNA